MRRRRANGPDFACNSANWERPHSVFTNVWNDVSMKRSVRDRTDLFAGHSGIWSDRRVLHPRTRRTHPHPV
jgi:hypothetical protein